MRFLPFCRYAGIGVVVGTLFNARELHHAFKSNSAAFSAEVEAMAVQDRQLDALERRAALLGQRLS